MQASKSSQFWLFVFAILALSLYIQRTSARVSCAAGQQFIETRSSYHGWNRDNCPAAERECLNICRDRGRKVVKVDCTVEGLLKDWYKCSACCGEPLNPPSPPPPSPPPPSPPPPPPSPPPPSPPPSPPPHSPPPPSPPPPSPPPPPPSPPPPPPSPPPPSPTPPSAPVGFCRAGQTSDVSPMTDCSLCTRGYCGNRCPGGITSVKKVGGCNVVSKACRCCCETSTLSISNTGLGSSLFTTAQ